MTAQDAFDRRLGDALLAYASDAPVEPDPLQFAAAIAAAHPRRRLAVLRSGLGRMAQRPLWIAVAMLILAAAIGAALVGMRPTDRNPISLGLDHQVPAALYGRWVAGDGAAEYVDLNAAWLVHGADGQVLESMGWVAAFLPDSREGIEGTLLIHSGLPCGDASYRLVLDETPSEGPTAAPAPAASPARGPRSVDRIRFVDPVDPCFARKSILADRSWSRMRNSLTAGGTFDSLGFGEPFHITLPADAGLGLPDANVGTMYELVPGQLRFSHPWWNAEFVDDIAVNRVPCRPDLGTLPDIPGSVDDVGAWLEAGTEVRFVGRTELVVDGRLALRWEVSADCPTATSAISDLATGYEFYAIPTGDDVILFVVRPDTPNESKVAERIVLALRFD